MQSVSSGNPGPTPTNVRLTQQNRSKFAPIDLPKGAITYGLVTVTTAIVDRAGQR